jgi:hypothetical protein
MASSCSGSQGRKRPGVKCVQEFSVDLDKLVRRFVLAILAKGSGDLLAHVSRYTRNNGDDANDVRCFASDRPCVRSLLQDVI